MQTNPRGGGGIQFHYVQYPHMHSVGGANTICFGFGSRGPSLNGTCGPPSCLAPPGHLCRHCLPGERRGICG